MPEGSQVYVERVIAGADRMQSLIRDLLHFSRLGLRPVAKRSIAVSSLVHGVVEELQEHERGRHVEVRVGELPDALADPGLLRQVFVNLISNALKFTRRREVALIEVGSLQHGNEIVYFVGDNGSGFEMKYVNRLFGVFERLHNDAQFEGTGIGLSVVRRIIERHGGRVWAEGEVERGATFSFSLPCTEPESRS